MLKTKWTEKNLLYRFFRFSIQKTVLFLLNCPELSYFFFQTLRNPDIYLGKRLDFSYVACYGINGLCKFNYFVTNAEEKGLLYTFGLNMITSLYV